MQDDEETRAAYNRWLKHTEHPRTVLVSYAKFEVFVAEKTDLGDEQKEQSVLRAKGK